MRHSSVIVEPPDTRRRTITLGARRRRDNAWRHGRSRDVVSGRPEGNGGYCYPPTVRFNARPFSSPSRRRLGTDAVRTLGDVPRDWSRLAPEQDQRASNQTTKRPFEENLAPESRGICKVVVVRRRSREPRGVPDGIARNLSAPTNRIAERVPRRQQHDGDASRDQYSSAQLKGNMD